MGTIAGLIILGLVAYMLFAPPPKPPARCPVCKQLLPPVPKQKSEVIPIIFLIVLIILLAWASGK